MALRLSNRKGMVFAVLSQISGKSLELKKAVPNHDDKRKRTCPGWNSLWLLSKQGQIAISPPH
jgi:hypothetical protein